MRSGIIVSLALLVPTAALAQGVKAGPQDAPDVNFQHKVDKAIKQGLDYLVGCNACSHFKEGDHHYQKNCNELILLTFLHGGLDEKHPRFQELFKEIMESQLERTYKVALMAMFLEEYERVKYQWRIHQCAQFLIDNQGPKGGWRYGNPSIYVEDILPVPTTTRRNVASRGRRSGSGNGVTRFDSSSPLHRAKPKVQRRILVQKKRDGQADVDHSNTQYAALGVRSCHDAGIVFPKDLMKLARQWWIDAQKKEKGVKKERLDLELKVQPNRRSRRRAGNTRVTQAALAEPQGWCYGKHDGHKAYGSMTAGAIGAICIYDYILEEDWTKNQDALDGLQWVNKNWSVTGNPGPHEHKDFAENTQHHYYYWMYGLERAGMLYGTELIGTHRWYREGAEELLKRQKGGGGWGGTVNTCFAILFLKRATARLIDVATTAAGGRK